MEILLIKKDWYIKRRGFIQRRMETVNYLYVVLFRFPPQIEALRLLIISQDTETLECGSSLFVGQPVSVDGLRETIVSVLMMRNVLYL